MPLEVILTTNRITHDPTARDLIQHLQSNATALGLDEAVLYYDFPGYADYETVLHKPDALLVSPSHGILALRFLAGTVRDAALSAAQDSLGEFSSMLIGRLLKSRKLRKTLKTLSFEVSPLLVSLSPHCQISCSTDDIEVPIVASLGALDRAITDAAIADIDAQQFEEIRSVIEGAKALAPPKKRDIADPEAQPMAAALATLDREITNFDQNQRRAALNMVPGPQRIRGLAGSGKTIILAMKAAELHRTDRTKKILVTFYTKSLRGTLHTLIDRFYRHNTEVGPDWESIHIRHGWGGAVPGTYSETCKRDGHPRLSLSDALQASQGKDALGYACRELVKKGVQPYYDHILIDEGQDFPPGFYELCFALAKGDRDSKSIVWTYDELQNIFNVRVPTPERLFGKDTDGKPRISLERAARNQPLGVTNDTVLSKCYRNQREVLMTAHALGFGIYHEIVQLLESREHWQDVGYDVIAPKRNFRVGDQVKIERPKENSPLSIDVSATPPLIVSYAAPSLSDEISWVTENIKLFIAGGLQPEEIIVINLDDAHSKTMLRELTRSLSSLGLSVNNINEDWGAPPFIEKGKITLYTVYKAKGNEACAAFVMGIDAINRRLRSDRNKLFTAFTRTKAWLRISGTAGNAAPLVAEIETACRNFPYLTFEMQDLSKVDLIQRDLSDQAIEDKSSRDEIIKLLKSKNYSDERIESFLLEWRRGRPPGSA